MEKRRQTPTRSGLRLTVSISLLFLPLFFIILVVVLSEVYDMAVIPLPADSDAWCRQMLRVLSFLLFIYFLFSNLLHFSSLLHTRYRKNVKFSKVLSYWKLVWKSKFNRSLQLLQFVASLHQENWIFLSGYWVIHVFPKRINWRVASVLFLTSNLSTSLRSWNPRERPTEDARRGFILRARWKKIKKHQLALSSKAKLCSDINSIFVFFGRGRDNKPLELHLATTNNDNFFRSARFFMFRLQKKLFTRSYFYSVGLLLNQ